MNIICIIVAIVGGILFSLYAISPPQGIDLGENSTTQDQLAFNQEVNNIYSDVSDLKKDANDLKETVRSSYFLSPEDRKQLDDHIAELNQKIGELQKDADNVGHHE